MHLPIRQRHARCGGEQAMIGRLRELLDRRRGHDAATGPPDAEDGATRLEELLAVPAADLDATTALDLLETNDLAAHRRAVSWLVGVDELTANGAGTLLETCLGNLRSQDHFQKRIAMRSIRALYRRHPDLVADAVPAFLHAFADYHAAVREETVKTVAAIIADRPALAGAVYGQLLRDSPDHREPVWRALLEADRPVVFLPLVPAMHRELGRDRVADATVDRAVATYLDAADAPDTSLVTRALERHRAGARFPHRALLAAVVARCDWDAETVDAAIPPVLECLARREEGFGAGARWLQDCRDRPAWDEGISDWAADAPQTDRRRVAVRVQEAFGSVDPDLLAALALEDDPFYSSFLDR